MAETEIDSPAAAPEDAHPPASPAADEPSTDQQAANTEVNDDADSTQALTTTASSENKVLSTTTRPDGSVLEILLTPAGKKIKRLTTRKKRPARVQIDPETLAANRAEGTPQTGTVYNVWYNKSSGGDSSTADALQRSTPAATRVNIARDSGYTAADAVPGSLFCLFFARGTCPKGRACAFLHRLPNSIYDLNSGQADIFGREKHADYRDDMGGVGSFTRQNRTLYVGRCSPRDDIEEVAARHFAEFGPIERIRCLTGRGVAFVTYATEALAQFAKEAMDRQALDDGEVLNVRWATADPNPVAQKREARAIDAQAAAAIKRVLPPEIVAELEGDEGAKRRRIEGDFGLDGYRPTGEVWMAAQRGGIEAPPEQGVEGGEYAMGPDEDGEGGDTQSVLTRPTESKGGFFGASTLKALKGFDSTEVTREQQPQKQGGALVDYGGDEDEDDW